MALRVLAHMLALMAVPGASPLAAAAKAPPRFAMAESVTREPDGSGEPGAAQRSVDCVEGRVGARQPVLLLSATGSETCVARAEETVTGTEPGWTCTVVTVKEPCTRGWQVGVIGARSGVYRRLEPKPIGDAKRLEALGAAIAASGVAEAATARGREERALGEKETIEPALAGALFFPGLPGDLVFARLRATGEAVELGPWVVFEGGAPATMIGPLALSRLAAFTLDGAGYVHAERAGCTGCGAVQNEIYAVEGARLRRVFQTTFGSN